MSERPPDMYTVTEASEALTGSKYGGYGLMEKLIRSGELPVVKIGSRRWVQPADIERLLLARMGVTDLAAARDKIARLTAQVDQLTAAARGLTWRVEPERQMAAREALSILSLDECMDILGRIENEQEPWSARRKAAQDAMRRVQAQLDALDAPAAVGKRPKGVPRNAKHKTVATAVGPIDLWYWLRPNGNWDASPGGPRARWPGGLGHPSKREALKRAMWHIRNEYGKPSRRTGNRLRFLILERDAFTCRYCGRKAPDVELHVDHATAIADGGTDTEDNLVTACVDCNLGKAGRSIPL